MNLFDVSQEAFALKMNNKMHHSKGTPLRAELIEFYKTTKGAKALNSLLHEPKATKPLKDIIFKHTGINVNIITTRGLFGCIFPDISKNTVLSASFRTVFNKGEELKRFAGEIRGNIDLKNYRISGDFSKIECNLYIHSHMVTHPNLPPEFIADVTLHEIGHLFYNFMTVAHFYSTNVPMLATLNRITKTKDPKEIEYHLKEYNETLKTEPLAATELSSKKQLVIVTAILNKVREEAYSSTGASEYETVNDEYLADRFVILNGGNFNYMENTDFLNDIVTQKAFKNNLATVVFEDLILGLIAIPFLPFYFTFLLLSTFTNKQIPKTFNVGKWAFARNSTSGEGIYDIPHNRIVRMREVMVEALKDKEIDSLLGERLRKDIKATDILLKEYKHNKFILAFIYEAINFKARRRMRQTEFYRELEKLSNNDLYLAAFDINSLLK